MVDLEKHCAWLNYRCFEQLFCLAGTHRRAELSRVAGRGSTSHGIIFRVSDCMKGDCREDTQKLQ